MTKRTNYKKTFNSTAAQEVEQPYYQGDGNHSVRELESICRQYKEYVHQLMTQETYTKEQVKQYAFWAVQHSAKLEKENPGKPIHKSQIDEYLDFEIG